MNNIFYQIIFLLLAVGLVIGIKLLSSPKTAKFGNALAAFSMALAVIFTLAEGGFNKFMPIMACMGFGSVVGIAWAQRVKMTAMPQLVALLNGFGGLASVLVALSETMRFLSLQADLSLGFAITSWVSIVVGAITLTGSVIAYLKLEELMSTKAIIFFAQRFITILFSLSVLVGLIFIVKNPACIFLFLLTAFISAILGVLLVIPIGGADMPVVISLLNSYSGIAAMAAGFVVESNLLIIAGALVGASGIILTRLMCQAMNRSLINVIFGAFYAKQSILLKSEQKPMREFSPMDAAMFLSTASRVIMVPGYGLAVSQAQRNLRELSDELKAKGVNIFYAIHPVAGRMPGHMNVLLAEADVPYNELYDLDQINSEFENADVCLIVGANDVVNPDSRTNKDSPLYGMPILNADKAKTVIVLKRGKGSGFSGVENPLFTLDNSGLVFGDAKASLVKIIQEVKSI